MQLILLYIFFKNFHFFCKFPWPVTSNKFECKNVFFSSHRQKMLQLRHAVVLCFLFLPLLRCKNLLCYFSPVLDIKKELTFELIVTECPPKEVCFKGLGRYGNYTSLSARGCMLEERCSHRVNIRIKGTTHIMTYSCCDWQFCNSCSALKPFCVTVVLVAGVVLVSGLWVTQDRMVQHPVQKHWGVYHNGDRRSYLTVNILIFFNNKFW